MIKQTKEEADAYIPLQGSRNTKVAAMLAQLKVGEAIIIEKGKDWVTKSSPFKVVNNFARKHNLKFEKKYANDGKGWWIRRLE